MFNYASLMYIIASIMVINVIVILIIDLVDMSRCVNCRKLMIPKYPFMRKYKIKNKKDGLVESACKCSKCGLFYLVEDGYTVPLQKNSVEIIKEPKNMKLIDLIKFLSYGSIILIVILKLWLPIIKSILDI
jgi:hypothetical protein